MLLWNSSCRGLLAVVALLALSPIVARGQAPSPVKTPEEEKQLAEILGSPLDDWHFGRRGGAEFDHKLLKTSDGRTVLAGGPFATILDRKSPLENDTELKIVLRLAHPQRKTVWWWLQLGHTDRAKYYESPHGLSFNLLEGEENEAFYWTVKPAPGEKTATTGTYSSRALPKNRLTWPELVRARIESDWASLPALPERWLTIRIVFRAGSIRYWLDDRLLTEVTGDAAKVAGSGLLNMTLFDGVQLASIRTSKVPPDDPRFVTVPLDSDLNSNELAGRKLTAADLPKAGESAVVDGVPFVIPKPDAAGNNHIDLKPSWLPCGTLDGQFDAGSGDLARWQGALHRDRGRIQFRVPNGRYAKLHVLAAYTGERDTSNLFNVQFYRPGAGHPIDFRSGVKLDTRPSSGNRGSAAEGLPKIARVDVSLYPQTGLSGVTGLEAFSDEKWLEFELTKLLRPYRSFPDPIYYGKHAAGIPTGVHVFALTLEKPEVECEFVPDAYAHVWTAPEQPSYTARLKNNTDVEQTVNLTFTTIPVGGGIHVSGGKPVKVPAWGTESTRLMTKASRYGLYDATLGGHQKDNSFRQHCRFAYLHPDTRERGGWEEGKGPIFGFWDWNGTHGTPSGMNRLRTMAAVGAESSMHSFESGAGTPTPALSPEEREFAEKNGMLTFFLGYQLSMGKHSLGGKDWDPKKPEEMQRALVEWLKSRPEAKTTRINRPDLAIFFAEPIVGPVSYMSLPHLYGEPEYQLTDAEKANYENYRAQFVTAAKAIKKEWPGTKCLFPWGLPLFPAPFLKDAEARDLMDGPCLDVVLFERLPEMQLHQVTLSSQLWQLKQEWQRAGKKWPSFTAIEGPAVSPAMPGALTPLQEADHTIRAMLILAAYGTTRHLGWPVPFACAGSWGETHYGSGMCEPIPVLCPKPVFCHYATMTRQLNRMNFVKQVPTGSNSVFCLQFKHYKSGELLHVFWTIRGKRPVTLETDAKSLTVIDPMDNEVDLKGTPTFTIDSSPVYIRGLKDDPKISLGEPDHSDAHITVASDWARRPPGTPSRSSRRDFTLPPEIPLGNLGDGTWKLSDERDLDYENSHREFVRRFPGKFSAKPVEVPGKVTGVALAVRLEPQEKERRTMPFYTTVVPAKPLVMPGTPSFIELRVKAASDWGRVVYCLRDAKGERWISVGRSGEWNVDDTHGWSQFCFDGWRLLRFELPGNAPYDLYRLAGTSFWGNYGPGDAIVDYPLTLEKIIVERRTHVIAGTELVPADPSDTLLGRLNVEYANSSDTDFDAVRQSRLRMPVPAAPPSLENPIAKRAETGVGAGPTITKVEPPEREYDGRRCHVHFTSVEGAKSYTVWASNYADGRGAIALGTNWTASGQLLTGLAPNLDLHLFVAATTTDGNTTKPSAAFAIRLKDMFPMK